MTQSDQADNLSLGASADVIKVSTANLTSADTIAGGNGEDTLKLLDVSTGSGISIFSIIGLLAGLGNWAGRVTILPFFQIPRTTD